jgi:hypothetical protein
VEPFDRFQDRTGFRVRARLNFDARTATAYGTLRTMIRVEHLRSSGAFNGLFSEEDDDTLGRPLIAEGPTRQTSLDLAFVQFAGFTAGRAQSFFDFYQNDVSFEDLRTSDRKTNLLAYTASFGEGYSATLAIEDPSERRFGGQPFGGFPFVVVPAPGDLPGSGALVHSGARWPDLVANVRLDQDWGEIQLSGALHELRPANFIDGRLAERGLGFALQAGAKLKLPFFANGSELWLQAAYAQGAADYLGLSEITQIGGVLVTGVDGYIDPFGKLKRSHGFGVLAALEHHWTPQLHHSLFAGYSRLSFPGVGQASVLDPLFGLVTTGFADFSELRFGANLIWTPVRGLKMGVEASYARIDPAGRVISTPILRGPNGFEQRSIDADDLWIIRARLQRDFSIGGTQPPPGAKKTMPRPPSG